MGISEDLSWSPQLAVTHGHLEEQKTSTPSALTLPPMRGKETKAKILTKQMNYHGVTDPLPPPSSSSKVLQRHKVHVPSSESKRVGVY